MADLKTDFSTWQRESLEKFAQEVSEQNRILRDENKILLNQWRELVKGQLTPAAARQV